MNIICYNITGRYEAIIMYGFEVSEGVFKW